MIETCEHLRHIDLTPLFFVAMALNRLQREFILRRDEQSCQAPFSHNCNGSKEIQVQERKLAVHHILCQRYLYSLSVDPDFELNLITVCDNAHRKIHPDLDRTMRNYYRTPDAFKKLETERNEKIKQREIYWNTEHDRQMTTVSVRRSQRHKLQFPHDTYPQHSKNQTRQNQEKMRKYGRNENSQ